MQAFATLSKTSHDGLWVVIITNIPHALQTDKSCFKLSIAICFLSCKSNTISSINNIL